MKIEAFHASPYDFSDFQVQGQGLHFGSKESALEAASRKDSTIVWLYKVTLDISGFVESYDLGYNWYDSFKYEPKHVKGYIYSNKYEPSVKQSYMTWDPETIEMIEILSKEIVDITKFKL